MMSNRREFIRSAAVTAVAAGSGLLLPGAARAAPQPVPVPAAPRRIIALEEHFILPEFVDYLAETKQNIRPALFDKVVPILSDFGARRLEVMDKNGVDFAVLSLSGPGVQIEPDSARRRPGTAGQRPAGRGGGETAHPLRRLRPPRVAGPESRRG